MSDSRDFTPVISSHPEGFVHSPHRSIPNYWHISPHNPNHPSDQNGNHAFHPTKKPVRDSKRRATHSQIERRRREKINDRLITLRTIVPACVAEIEERKRIRLEEEEEARKIASGELSANSVRGGKRKRNRKRAIAATIKKEGDDDEKEEELGLHKLEVLTHTIDYIYQLQEHIQELETGIIPQKRRITDDEERELETSQTMIESSPSRAAQERTLPMEEDDEESSEAHLEMAEWKGIQLKSITKTGQRSSHGRRSTIASSDHSTSLNPSPNTFGNFMGESPLFPGGAASSSSSNFTSLTSPMMSLSAESPIMCLGIGSSSTMASPKANKEQEETNTFTETSSQQTRHKSSSSSAASLASSTNKNRSTLKSWNLPSPALSAIDFRQRAKSVASHKLPSLTRPEQHHDQDAQLLLAFSTSPEVLRPTSAERLSNVRDSTDSHPDHGNKFSRPLRMSKIVDGRSIVLGSAPGGTQPSLHSSLLPSPPFLALDKAMENLEQKPSHQLHSD